MLDTKYCFVSERFFVRFSLLRLKRILSRISINYVIYYLIITDKIKYNIRIACFGIICSRVDIFQKS